MSECQLIDPLVTPFIDGELAAADRERVSRHLGACAPCYSRVHAERSVRSLLRQRQAAFKGECAPVSLRVRCAGHCGVTAASRAALRWRHTMMPLALAATVVLGVGGSALLYRATRASQVMAAELTADHVKCFAEPASAHASESADVVDAALASQFGWRVHVPQAVAQEGLELVSARSCLYDGKRVAHILYRHHGEPMSLFMVPATTSRRRVVETAGHECAIWEGDGRTYVLVSREPKAEVERLASIVRPSFH